MSADASDAGTSFARPALLAWIRETMAIYENSRPMTRRKPTPSAVMSDPENWLTPEQFAAEFPNIAHAFAIRRDVWRRGELGLVAIDAVRQVGKRVLIHRHRYAAWRLGDLRSPTATRSKRPKRPKRTPPDTSDT